MSQPIALKIFEDIFELIERCKTNVPKPIEDSKFYSGLLKLREEYCNGKY